jgi:ABC-2 type transport system permease protein
MNATRLSLRQVRFEQKSFWRNPASAFFTFAFPLMFLVIFTSLLGGGETRLPTGEKTSQATYYVAAILSFSVVTACYTNIAIGVAFVRDEGVLKRIRGTPLPPTSYLLGKVFHSITIMVLLAAIVMVFGRIVYDVSFPTDSLPAFVATLLLGSAAFCLLGLAVTSFTPNAEAAPAVVNGIILPLLFISGIFIPLDNAPGWMVTIGDFFPVKHFFNATSEAYIPFEDPSGWSGSDLLIVAVWGVVGLIVAARFFSWEPRR